MNKLARSLFAGGAIALLSYSPAAANHTSPAADVFVITGSGTISPGLGAVPPGAPQSVSFTGTATTVGSHGTPGTYSCSFSGSDILGSAAQGVGTVSGSCGPISFPSCTFGRVTVAVVVVCPPFDHGSGTATATAVCAFTPTSTNPTKTYDLVCTGAYASVPV